MKRATVVVGLGFGDEGKGLMTDYFTRDTMATLVVRFNGGCQAAHNVITPEGVHHTFSQVGSGSFAGADTFLSRYMLVEPVALAAEREVLAGKINGPPRVIVDPRCTVITPYHQLANRLREQQRGCDRHGSVGLGVGEARQDELAGLSLRIRDLKRRDTAEGVLRQIKAHKLAEFTGVSGTLVGEIENLQPNEVAESLVENISGVEISSWADVHAKHEAVVFEGAQGALLDERYGFAPFNTWTNCTLDNALTLIDATGCVDRLTCGVTRSYHTRHGAGPFITEDPELSNREVHNVAHPWMGEFRLGHLDLVALRYGWGVAGRPDCIAVTHMDAPISSIACTGWGNKRALIPPIAAADLADLEPTWARVDCIPTAIAAELDAPVRFLSFGPSACDIRRTEENGGQKWAAAWMRLNHRSLGTKQNSLRGG